VAQHSWTSASYQDVMNSITDVSPPQQQSNNNYMAVATLSSRIPTNSVNSDRFSLDAKRGTTSHVYLFGQGNGFGFSNIATMFPAPSSPPPTGYWQYVP
jgi:hypothetical protein